ncbi:hypothetical protein Moror_2782 [Moniliophthora roreri MCA 2997]|uniref:Uncharacterized protein n=2 Tax=Moniliophthora roreri TaxID=221103 RepID=V2YHZ4_MONRO|nr:hypothetical protein Moror_2782 [Moniliophthora roreri MCA 2997]KAI3598091.1 hypothetical protein WG66_009115 [Moniliophthora roreri]
MSSEGLPLKVRADIRDQWDSSKASIKETVEALNKSLGHQLTPEAEWPALWTNLQSRFPDKSTFVPTIVRYVIAWYERLLGRIENDNYTDWTEELLNVLAENKRALRVKVEPCPTNNSSRPLTKWNATLGSFSIGIPNVDPIPQSRLSSIWDSCFDNFFTNAEPSSVAAEDDWADVTEEPQTRQRAVANGSNAPQPSQHQVERLPTINALARPNELFVSTTPHILMVHYRTDKITVQCSHQPSLELLETYLKKWAKTNTNDSLRRPVYKFELLESDFSFGIIDTLEIEPHMPRHVRPLNPTMVLAFIEGVLGYEMVHTTTGSTWMYRSKTALK